MAVKVVKDKVGDVEVGAQKSRQGRELGVVRAEQVCGRGDVKSWGGSGAQPRQPGEVFFQAESSCR